MDKEYWVYTYEHIDVPDEFFHCWAWLKEDLSSITPDLAARLFRRAGWQGDGEIGLIWLPPFLFKDADTYGVHVWHVKQSNNGTSFIASRCPLDLPGLCGGERFTVEMNEAAQLANKITEAMSRAADRLIARMRIRRSGPAS